jgi:hypothetical protein
MAVARKLPEVRSRIGSAVARAVAGEMSASSAPATQSTGHLTASVSTGVTPDRSNIQKNIWKKARPDSGPNLSNTARCLASGTRFKV